MLQQVNAVSFGYCSGATTSVGAADKVPRVSLQNDQI